VERTPEREDLEDLMNDTTSINTTDRAVSQPNKNKKENITLQETIK